MNAASNSVVDNAPLLSIVTPVYGRKLDLDALVTRIRDAVEPVSPNFEIILVNDASPDNSWPVIEQLAEQDARIVGVNLSRNFGQHPAISAGISISRGKWVVVMDCDLQDPPEDIPKLLEKAEEGYDVVFGKRSNRNDPIHKKLSSKLFFWFIRNGCGLSHEPETANFGIFSERVVNELRGELQYGMPFMRALNDLGFTRGTVTVGHSGRELGESSYSMGKRISLAIDSIVSYSNRPLKVAIMAGFVMAGFAALYALILVIRYFTFSQPPAGWTSVIVSLYLISGIMMVVLGVVGLYVGQVFDSARRRPSFVIQEIKSQESNKE